jgi:hypothetical protein
LQYFLEKQVWDTPGTIYTPDAYIHTRHEEVKQMFKETQQLKKALASLKAHTQDQSISLITVPLNTIRGAETAIEPSRAIAAAIISEKRSAALVAAIQTITRWNCKWTEKKRDPNIYR